jgi:glycosyltransferase involved in cell wall biosynthesis
MKNKIKLLIVTPYFHPKIGGLENYAFNISKGLMKDYNYKVVVITSNHEDKTYKEEKLEGIKIYRLPYQFKVSNTPISFKWKKQIREIIQKEQPDIINAHTPVPFISDVTCRVAHKLKIPFILTYHSGSMKKDNAFLKNIVILFYEHITLMKTLDYSKKIICSSDFVKNEFFKKINGNIITITPGVDLSLFKEENMDNKQNQILFVGNLNKSNEWKGLPYLIEAIKKIKNTLSIKLLIIGKGDKLNDYLNLCKTENISCYFPGELKGKKLVDLYNQSKILVLPSISEAESFGMVLIEAMACKKPVIGSNIGGMPYVIDEGINGLLVPPRNTEALTNAIVKILKNPKLAKQMGENGYKKVKENFTWEIQNKKMNEIFKEVLKK